MQSLFFLITIMFQLGINKKSTFNKHFARKYIRAYTSRPTLAYRIHFDSININDWTDYKILLKWAIGQMLF